jgi:hypothetical protein
MRRLCATDQMRVELKEPAYSVKTTCRLSQFERFKLRDGRAKRIDKSRLSCSRKSSVYPGYPHGVSQSIAGLTRIEFVDAAGAFRTRGTKTA